MPSELDVLCDRLRSFAAARGWGGGHSVRNLALALSAEVGELGAELQWIDDARVGRHLQDPAARARIADEAADVLIYLVQFADVCGIDLLAEAYAKIERNESRFPPQIKAGGVPGNHVAHIQVLAGSPRSVLQPVRGSASLLRIEVFRRQNRLLTNCPYVLRMRMSRFRWRVRTKNHA